jgi:hypothetical protein
MIKTFGLIAQINIQTYISCGRLQKIAKKTVRSWQKSAGRIQCLLEQTTSASLLFLSPLCYEVYEETTVFPPPPPRGGGGIVTVDQCCWKPPSAPRQCLVLYLLY